MLEQHHTAICLCTPMHGYNNLVNLGEIAEYARQKLKLKEIWYAKDLPLLDSNLIAEQIKQSQTEQIILIGDKPGYLKPLFSRALYKAGKNSENVTLVSLSEYGATKSFHTERAKALLACAFYEIPFENIQNSKTNKVNSKTLVIGGGIAGIQASLEIANANQKVYLLERTGTIGGHMAMFDKTFPTLDCAACILTPKMVEVGQHPNINLLTYSELVEIEGVPGNYIAKIKKKARRVDISTCIGCGTCSEKCPAKVPSEFDEGTGLRKAIYLPFPQAVPNKYLIDADNCIYVKNGKCGVCVKVCPVENCINLDAKDEEIEINVGNIIVATGFKTFDAKKIERYGYGKFDNVLTSLEFERLINAAGPTGGNITLRSTDKKGNKIFLPEGDIPRKIAIIHCIGSRDENYNKYCSKVCCMYSLKLAHLVKEKLPDAEVFEHYIDMRAFGKGYEEFYNRIKKEGVHVIRGRTAKVEEKNGKLLVRSEDIEANKLMEEEVDMVILSVGLEPDNDAKSLASMLGLSFDSEGWFKEFNYTGDPVGTYNGGIMLAGVCQGPKDIPDTVAQASASAARVLQNIMNGTVSIGINNLTLDDIELEIEKLTTLNKELS